MERSLKLFLILNFIFHCNGFNCRQEPHCDHLSQKLYQYDSREVSPILGVPVRADHMSEANGFYVRNEGENNNQGNYITVPPNCPPGQVFTHGRCREIWNKLAVTPSPLSRLNEGGNNNQRNFITVPTNCPPGQVFTHGRCREIWNKLAVTPSPLSRLNEGGNNNQRNYITVPTNCPPGQVFTDGRCREIWNRMAVTPSTRSRFEQLDRFGDE